ncbi:MAG: lasso peptide biosynthesis B2 protein [Chloroflexi bacterium]|nr:lasso peptide biosynthesis B2 protein [Chloroflexota bacterium]
MLISILKRKLKTFSNLSWGVRILFFETYLHLGLARAAVLTLPFYWLSRRWGVPMFKELRYPHENREFLRQLAWAIRTASRYTPWKSNCLAQAIAAKTMLRRRGHTSTLYLGMTTPGSHPEGKVEAHAWLRCGDTWICGLHAS